MKLEAQDRHDSRHFAGGAQPNGKLMVVSLHDVAPPFEGDVRDQLAQLEILGITRFVLKLVPNWHGQHPLARSSTFVALLNGMHERGAQIVLHGYRHCPSAQWRGSPLRQARARLFARSAAEFMTLTGSEARIAVEMGIEQLSASGLSRPTTFCAPGWLLTDEAEDALVESGLQYLVGMFSLVDLSGGFNAHSSKPRARRGQSLWWIPSEGYMGGGDWHEFGVRALNASVRTASPGTQIRKIYLHPDPSGRRRWMGAVRRVGELLEQGWEVATLEDAAMRRTRPESTT